MQAEERCMELTGDLFKEFEETRTLAESEDSVTYSTWTRVCSSVYTIICCQYANRRRGESVCTFASFPVLEEHMKKENCIYYE